MGASGGGLLWAATLSRISTAIAAITPSKITHTPALRQCHHNGASMTAGRSISFGPALGMAAKKKRGAGGDSVRGLLFWPCRQQERGYSS